MVNTGKRSCNNSGEKRGAERQKLADELSFLAGLIRKHKDKPAAKESNQSASGYSSNQFSWTKERPSSSSSHSSTHSTIRKQGQRSQSSHYLPSKDRLTWKKPKERSDDHLTSEARRYTYFAKDVPKTAIERNSNGKAVVFTSKNKSSSESATSQHSHPEKNDHPRRIVVPQQGSKLISAETGRFKACPPSGVSTLVKPEELGKADSTDHGLPARKATSLEYESEDRSSDSNRQQNKRIVVLPTFQKPNALKPDANIGEIHGLSGNTRKQTVSVKLSSELPRALASDSTATKMIMPEQSSRDVHHEKQHGERQNSRVLATLSKELDRCLGDIARLKETRTRTNEGSPKFIAGIRKPPCVNVRDTDTEKTAGLAGSQKSRSNTNQGCKLKFSMTNDKLRESKLEEKASGTKCSALPRSSDYKWMAPKVKSPKVSSSNIGDFSGQKAQGTDNLLQKKGVPVRAQVGTEIKNLNKGLKPMMQITSPRMKIIRTKYKMKKQLSAASSLSVISQHKVDHRKVVGTPAPKSAEKTNVPKRNVNISRYKLVKESSHPGALPPKYPETSSLSPRKPQVAINSRYKKVKGHSHALESPRKSAIVIPHRSQLKLNRMKTKPNQKNTTKSVPTSTSNRKQSKHKIDRRPRGTAVVRSRFKMRKVSSRTPRKTPPKQSSNSSPFKWQAKKVTPTKPATPDTFMRRRMHYVLTHTPVLLRTRFRLVNSENNNSTGVTGHSPKQPLLKNTRTKLIRKSATPSSPSQKQPGPRLVIAKGVHYHQSKSGKSLRRISGSSPVLASSAHRSAATSRLRQGSLSRSWTASMHRWSQRQSTTKVSSTQWVANRVLRRTIQDKIQRGNKNLKREPYCKFYNRYGRCHRGDECPYIHDPDKVAVCTQFLRGTCKKTDGSCPFSHKISKDKMPVCVYFLKGVCNRDNCPYSHVKVSKKAEVCQEFLHGYCPRGAKCKKKHTLDCAEFNETGQCKLGNKCPLWHRKHRTKNEGRKGVKRRASEGDKVSSKRSNTTRDKPMSKPEQDAVLVEYVSITADDDDPDTPEADSESGGMPSFIALDSDSYQSTSEHSTLKKTSPSGDGGRPALKIRPLFAPSMGASTSHQGQRRDISSSSSSLQKTSVPMATGCSSEEEDTHP